MEIDACPIGGCQVIDFWSVYGVFCLFFSSSLIVSRWSSKVDCKTMVSGLVTSVCEVRSVWREFVLQIDIKMDLTRLSSPNSGSESPCSALSFRVIDTKEEFEISFLTHRWPE